MSDAYTVHKEAADKALEMLETSARQLARTGGMLNKDVARDAAKAASVFRDALMTVRYGGEEITGPEKERIEALRVKQAERHSSVRGIGGSRPDIDESLATEGSANA